MEEDSDEDLYGEAYDADDEARSTVSSNYAISHLRTSYSLQIAPAVREDNFIVPFPSRIIASMSISGPESDFDLPFPPLKKTSCMTEDSHN